MRERQILFPAEETVNNIDYCKQVINNLRGVSIASLNICSLVRKIDKLRILLSQSNLDILALNETFLKSVIDNELNIPGYRLIRSDRTAALGKSCGGGIAIYVRQEHNVKIIENGLLSQHPSGGHNRALI